MKPELERYIELVRAWPTNLVSRDELDRLELHVDDALAGAAVIRALGVRHVADVGTGAGIPGLILGLELKELELELIEARSAKVAFLRSCITELQLGSRVRVHHRRAEQVVSELGRESLDAAMCRALAPPVVAAELLSPLVRPGGALCLWTTRSMTEQQLPLRGIEELGLGPPDIVGAASELREGGVLVVWPKHSPAAERFPRRPGVASRRPLR